MNDQTDKTRNRNRASTDKFFTPPLILIFLIVFIDLIGFGMVIPILPIYAQNAPFLASPWEIGWLVSIYSWMQFVFSPLLGKLSDKYGRRPILFISLLGSAAGYVVLGLANTLLLVFVGRIISGITGGNISAAQAYIADVTTKENRGKGMALFGAAFGLGFRSRAGDRRHHEQVRRACSVLYRGRFVADCRRGRLSRLARDAPQRMSRPNRSNQSDGSRDFSAR